MDTTAIRQDLIEKIKSSLSDDVIMDIARLIEVDDQEIYIFSDEEQKLVQKAIKSYEEGSFLTAKAAEEDIQQWLKD